MAQGHPAGLLPTSGGSRSTPNRTERAEPSVLQPGCTSRYEARSGFPSPTSQCFPACETERNRTEWNDVGVFFPMRSEVGVPFPYVGVLFPMRRGKGRGPSHPLGPLTIRWICGPGTIRTYDQADTGSNPVGLRIGLMALPIARSGGSDLKTGQRLPLARHPWRDRNGARNRCCGSPLPRLQSDARNSALGCVAPRSENCSTPASPT